jgi:hypothetical protein
MPKQNKTDTYTLTDGAQRWAVNVQESETRVVIAITSKPANAVMSDAARTLFLDPILERYENSRKPVLIGNRERGWALAVAGEAVLCKKRPA